MSKLYNYVPLKNLGGGLNESISDVQQNSNEAITAQNIVFERYGSYGKLRKRTGRVRVNSSAMPGTVKEIIPFTLEDTAYLQYFVKGASNNYMYADTLDDSGNPTGVTVSAAIFDASDRIPSFDIIGDKLFGVFPQSSALIDSCDATLSATALSGTIAGVWRGQYIDGDGAVNLDIEKEEEFYTEGSESYKITTTGAVATGFIGITGTYSAAGFTVENKLVSVDLMVEATLRDQNESDKYEDEYNPSIVRIKMFNMEDDGSFTNGAQYTVTAPSDRTKILSKVFSTYIVDPASTENENGWTYSAFGSGLDTGKDIGKLALEFSLEGSSSDDDDDSGETVSLYVDNVRTDSKYSGLMYYTATDGWTKVLDGAAPRDPNIVVEYDGRLWAIEDNKLYYSYPGDGINFKEGGSFSIGEGDGDEITAARKLGDELIVFKRFSIARVSPATSSLIPYRSKRVYSGDVKQKGIGCVASRTVKNVILGTPSDDYLGALEYLLFIAYNGLYAIGSTGAPIRISKRVKETLEENSSIDKDLCFAGISPEESLYILGLSDTDGESDSQIVYGTSSKSFSTFDFADIHSLSEISSDNKSYVLMGDDNGFVYKYGHFTNYDLSNYRDQGSDASYTGIEAIYQSKYNNYDNDGKSIQLQDIEVGTKAYATDCPISLNIYNENQDSISETINTVNATFTGDVYIKRLTTKLYGRYISHRFSNSATSQDMVVYFWKPGAFLLGA